MSRFKVLGILVLVVTLLLGVFGIARAASMAVGTALAVDENEIPSLVEVLTQIAQMGAAGVVIAFLFEHFTWFQNLPSSTKWWVVLGLSLGLPVLAQVLLEFVPPDIWGRLEPYWRALASGFLMWAGSQVSHLLAKRAQ